MVKTELENITREALAKKGLDLDIKKPKDLCEAERTAIVDTCWQIAIDAFGRWLPRDAIASRTGVAESVLLLQNSQGLRVGYAVNDAVVLAGMKTNYWSSALLSRGIQSNGIYGIINPLRATLIEGASAQMTRTQNPRVYTSFMNCCEETGLKVCPNGVPIPESAVEMAREFDPSVTPGLICRGVYNFGESGGARALMYETPVPTTSLTKKLWSSIDVEKGDAIIVLALPN